MAGRGMAVLAAAAVCLAAWAAQGQSGPPTSLQASKCWTCHRPGGTVEGQPLVSMYSLHPPASLALAEGQGTPLRVEVRNDWLATVHNIAGVLDLSQAPSLAFTPPPEPVLGVTRTGTLPFEAATATAPERSSLVQLPVPAGATDVRVRLVPDKQAGVDAPDLQMRVWAEGIAQDPQRAVVVDQGGKGLTETLHLKDIDAIGRLGYGNWSVAAVQAGFAARPDGGALEAQGFTVVLDAWFNLTGERTQVAASTARLDGKSDGPQSTVLQWNLFVQRAPRAGERLLFTVNAVASFDHPPQFNAVDDWAFTQTTTVPIAAAVPPGGGGVAPVTTITLNTTQPAAPVAASGGTLLTERILGESVGYFTAFVLLVSLVTGGLLGGGSRRALNKALGSAQRRIAFHNLTSYGILLAAAGHTWLFLDEAEFPWTLGLLWGGLAILAMAGLGVTGAWQLPLIRRWGYTPWRVVHYGLAVAALALTALHMGLDGIHFTDLQKAVHWRDPFAG